MTTSPKPFSRPAYPATRELSPALPVIATAGLTLLLIPFLGGSGGRGLLFGLLGLLGVGAILAWPHVGVLAILGVWFAEISPSFFDADFLRIPYLVTAVLALPLGLAVLRDGDVWVLRVPQVRILLAIGALYVAGTWWDGLRNPVPLLPQIDETERQLILFGSRLVFLVLLLYFVTTRGRIEAVVALVVAATAVSAIDAWNAVSASTSVDRATASMFDKNPNRLAFLCLAATALLWYFRSSARGVVQWLTLPLVFLLPATALATGSRSGFLQAVALAGWVLGGSRGVSHRFRNLLLVLCGLVFLVAVVPKPLLDRATRFDPDVAAPGQDSLHNRMLQLTSALRLFGSQPVLGIGIGNFEAYSEARNGVRGGVHNSYLRALTEGGAGVFALYLLLFGSTYRLLRRLERGGPPDLVWLASGLRISLVLFLISSLTGDIWLNEYLYLIVGLAVAIAVHGRAEAAPAPAPAFASRGMR